MNPTNPEHVTLELQYAPAATQPDSHGGQPMVPVRESELLVAIRDHPEFASDVISGNPSQLQVRIVGTAVGLQDLGTYLIALARCPTTDPEPYEDFNEVANVDGGTVRLIVQRVAALPPPTPRGPDYNGGFCRAP